MTARPRRTTPLPLRTRPSVSVVVPCYNYGHYVSTAVRSALDQVGLEVEVLVVDDASPDGSSAVALELARKDPRVEVLLHEENRGHIRTYNDGLAKARGDYVVLLSADDALPRDALTRAVALMEADPGVGLVYGWPQNFTDQPPESTTQVRSWSVWDGRDWLGHACRTGRNAIMSPEVVLRREAWEQAGPYDADLPHSADLALWLTTACGWDIGHVDGPPQAYYRVHGANMHLTEYAGMLLDLRQRHRCFEIVLTGPSAPADASSLLAQAGAALAREALDIAADPGLPDGQAEEFRTLAAELGPDVRPPVRLPAPVRRVGRSVRWHRWRRYGL